jgi:hypothetical protein
MSSGDALVGACRPEIEKFYALCDNGALEPIALMFRWLPRPRDTRPFSLVASFPRFHSVFVACFPRFTSRQRCCLFPKIRVVRVPAVFEAVRAASWQASRCRRT